MATIFRALSPILYTENLDETLRFYEDKLHYTIDAHDPKMGWASVKRDLVHIMFSLPNDHLPFDKPGFTGSLYLYVNEVDLLWKEYEPLELQVAYPIETFEYGMREFAIYDNNGYMLQFGQAVASLSRG